MFIFERDYDWKGLAAAINPEGRSWVDAYLRETTEIHSLIKESAAALRRLEIDESRDLLERAEAQRQALRPGHPSLFHTIGRFYFGGLAFYHFRRGDLDQADRAMVEAYDSIQAAIELERCLLPLAAVSLDIPLKRARIAHARRHWDEMRKHSADLRRASADREPLLSLFGREPVYHGTIARRLEALSGDGSSLLPGARYLRDGSLREEVATRLLGQLYLRPGFLIPYP